MQDFALEYFITDHKLHFVGYSLFESQNGVYRSNYLKSDEEIFTFLTKLVTEQSLIEAKHEIEIWLEIAVAARYEGPLGVDMYVYETAQGLCLNPLSEINFRHTMGHVAVALSQKKSTFASSKLSYNEIQQTGK